MNINELDKAIEEIAKLLGVKVVSGISSPVSKIKMLLKRIHLYVAPPLFKPCKPLIYVSTFDFTV
jgi:hypothetical protein